MRKREVIAIIGVILVYILAFGYISFAAEQSKSAVILNLELQVLQEQKKTAETEIARLNEALGRIQLQFQAQVILTREGLAKINTQIVDKTKEIEALKEEVQEPTKEE
jgi:peptidoglycan hydrolase CwlO-like protein